MKKYFYFLITLFILLTACSIPLKIDNSLKYSHYSTYRKMSFDFMTLDKDLRKELGIGLNVSPNEAIYFLQDIPSLNFRKLFLVDELNQEIEIFDFDSYFGRSIERDMIDLQFFWGGKSDRIFMYIPFADRPQLKQYLLDKHLWEDISINLEEKEKVITSIHDTNHLIIKGDSQYNSLDLSNGKRKELSIPYDAYLHEQKDKKILFSRIEETSNLNDRIVQIGIYDIVKDDENYLRLPIPASDGNMYISFVPNKPTKIAYMATPKDTNNEIFSYLIIYDYVENKYESIKIGSGVHTFLGWNLAGGAFYGVDYIMTKDEE